MSNRHEYPLLFNPALDHSLYPGECTMEPSGRDAEQLLKAEVEIREEIERERLEVVELDCLLAELAELELEDADERRRRIERKRRIDAKAQIDAMHGRLGMHLYYWDEILVGHHKITPFELERIVDYFKEATTPVELLAKVYQLDQHTWLGAHKQDSRKQILSDYYIGSVQQSAVRFIAAEADKRGSIEQKELYLNRVLRDLDLINAGHWIVARVTEKVRRILRHVEDLPADVPSSQDSPDPAGQLESKPSPATSETNTQAPEPLRWLGTAEQLAYLVHQLKEAGWIAAGRYWKQAASSFVRQDGEPFNPDTLRKTASKLDFARSGASSTRGDEIDVIIGEIGDFNGSDDPEVSP